LSDTETTRLAERVLAGDVPAIADALGLAEDTRPERMSAQRGLLRALEARTPARHTLVGVTGPPGAGKSSLCGALLRHLLDAGCGVGMIAVDPTSRRSGGALLGDRARLRIGPEERAFIRSMAARDRLGGLAPATRAAAVVLRAAYDWTLVETVGVGQSEVDVASLADTVVLVLQPGSGDTLQFMKAGILEIPDIFVVHKWDLGALAERTKADLEALLQVIAPPRAGWEPPVIGASAQTGHGVESLAAHLERHRTHLEASGERERRRAASRIVWVQELVEERWGTWGRDQLGGRDGIEKRSASLDGSALDVVESLRTRASLEP
jgi:LAO/AO transport system kinase